MHHCGYGHSVRKVENPIFYGFHSIDKNNIEHDQAVKLTKLITIMFFVCYIQEILLWQSTNQTKYLKRR